MIYIDTSVVLAHLLAEDRQPPASLWDEDLVSSRLLQYEVWTRINSRRLEASHSGLVDAILDRLLMLELAPAVLARAREPFPCPVRTLDALHLASLEFLREQRQMVQLASYDRRMLDAAAKLLIPVYSLS